MHQFITKRAAARLLGTAALVSALAFFAADTPLRAGEQPVRTNPQQGRGSSDAFVNVLSTGVHLVDFWASWCAPCRMQDPIIEKVAGGFADRVKVWKVDVDVNKDLPKLFGVSGVPTLFVVADGKVIHRFNGLQSEEELIDVLRGLF